MNFEADTILVDKPYTWTSFDVVKKLRWNIRQKLGVKKYKVGHAGTLDPLATGLLIICLGKNTKKIDSYMVGLKTYTGTILLGKTTPSFDLETEFENVKDTKEFEKMDFQEMANSFIGIQQQMPPIFSAKQVDGVRAYDLARAGKEVKLKTAEIEILKFNVDASNFPEINFEIQCTKGTYIRTIAHEFGQKIGSGGTLTALRRTKSGDFDIKEAKSVEEWIKIIIGEE